MKSFTLLLAAAIFQFASSWEQLELQPSEVQKVYGQQHRASEFSAKGQQGEQGYDGHHNFEKGAQGQHERENLKKQFAEAGGHKSGHNHKDGYYAQQHKGEKGQKGYNYADKGSYAKGHSTKGHHNIHKLDEFKKNKEFFDEDHDEAFKEKHGGFEHKNGYSGGGFDQGGHFKKVYLGGNYGKSGKFENGKFYFDDSGFKKALGHDGHYFNEEDYAKKAGHDGHKQHGFSTFTHH